MSKKLWGGRFTAPTHPDVERYTASIGFDSALAEEDILGSMAHAAMLAHCQIISGNECEQLHDGLRQIASKIAAGEVSFRVEDEDIHMNIERLLLEYCGATAGKLHTARSRNDQVALDMHLYLRKHLLINVELLVQLQTTLLDMAKRDQDAILPGYTHLQRAQPIYLAQHWLAYVAMLQRDITRLQDSWKRINQSPLGAAALTGTSFAIDRHYLAASLGFDGIYYNTLDAVSDRDFVVEFLAASSLIMMHLSRLSDEIILWSSQEFAFVSCDDAFSTGSSIMPQKKNPDVAELARGKTGRVYGSLITLLTLLKGLPLAYNKDMQEDKEPLFDTLKTLQQTLAIYSPLLASLKINSQKMRLAVDDGYLNATVLAEYLVKKGLTFRVAHEIVGRIVAHCVQQHCRLEELSIETFQQFALPISADVYDVLSAEQVIAACNSGNKAGIPLLAVELHHHQNNLAATQQWLAVKQQMLIAVYEQFGLVQ
ncbi:argininosuccinate lyase [soil metagenome]